MKKNWFFVFFVGLLVGCHEPDVEVMQVSQLAAYQAVTSYEKTPVYWELDLIDEWNEVTYQTIMNEYGYFSEEGLNEELLNELASDLATQIDTPMVNARMTEDGDLISGSERVVLSEAELVEQIQAVEAHDKELSLPITVTKPQVSKEDLVGIDQKVIGEFTTYFNSSVTGRSKNIELSSEAISNIVLGPGDTFSFNQMVGERTVERGYQEAMEIVNREFVMGIGGGICQTSSTLFNAVEKAGLEMIERYTHSREVGYVAAGRDATVSWGGPDFRFSNPHPYPVLIRAKVDQQHGELTITVHTHN